MAATMRHGILATRRDVFRSLTRMAATRRRLLDQDHRGGEPRAYSAVPSPNPGQQSGARVKSFPAARLANLPWMTLQRQKPADARSDTGEQTDPQRHRASHVSCLSASNRRHTRPTVGSTANREFHHPTGRHGRGAMPTLDD
jgi:hypothetical protein